MLDTLAEIGQISQERAADVKSKYEAIHSALVAAMEQEKQLLSQAQELHKETQVGSAEQQKLCGVCFWCRGKA